MKNNLLAAVDIGTNTFRLLIASVHHDPVKNIYVLSEIHSARIITRLGEDLAGQGVISGEAMERGISALRSFSDAIARHGAGVYAVATSALRDARNAGEFTDRAKKETGIDIEIISGDREAELTALGMLLDIHVPGSALMIDIGGGSTELIVAREDNFTFSKSMLLGVVHLADKYMQNDPPLREDLRRMEKEIEHHIGLLINSFVNRIDVKTVLMGTAGTITALAAMAQNLTRYEHDRVHKYRLSAGTVEQMYIELSSMTNEDRTRRIPFEPSRLDIIVPGALILLKLMKSFHFSEITVSNYGLREGILVDLYQKSAGVQ